MAFIFEVLGCQKEMTGRMRSFSFYLKGNLKIISKQKNCSPNILLGNRRLFPASSVKLYKEKHRGGGDKREQRGDAQRADDRDGQWFEHIRSGTDTISQGQQAQRRGERGHQHGAQASPA